LPRFHLEKPFVGPSQKPNALAWEIASHEVPNEQALEACQVKLITRQVRQAWKGFNTKYNMGHVPA